MSVLRKYGAATTILFPLVDRGTVDFEATPVSFVAADTQISKDEGAFANTGSTPAHEGNGIYSLPLTATEMQAARIAITCIDSATKAWEDQAIIIDTYGNASAQHAFDLDTDGPEQIWDEAKAGHTAGGSFGEEEQAHALSSEIAALEDLSAAQVNTEVADVVKTDTIAEMAQQAPPTNPTFEEAIMYLYMALAHKIDVTATLKEFHNNAGTVVYKKALSDDGTTYTEAESASGP